MSEAIDLYFRGYIGSRPIRGTSYPHRVQNLVVRTYAETKKLKLQLSATEYSVPHCYQMLSDAIDDLEKLGGIILYSLFLLPERRERRQKIYQRVFATNSALHFALEDLNISKPGDEVLIEEILFVQNALKQTPFSGHYEKEAEASRDPEFTKALSIELNSF